LPILRWESQAKSNRAREDYHFSDIEESVVARRQGRMPRLNHARS
jgi:hypothetical protein